jgi:hypothetical protein
MAFGFAGAAAGASDSLEGMLAQRRAEFLKQQELALRQQEEQRRAQEAAAQLAVQKDQEQRLARALTLSEAKDLVGQYDALGQGATVSPQDAQRLQGTPYAARLQTQPTLPATSMIGDPNVGMTRQSLGSIDLTTLKPTQAQTQEAGRREGQRRLVDLLQRNAPRSAVIGALAQSGENISGAMLNDPADKFANDNAQKEADRNLRLEIAQIGAQGRGANADLQREILQGRLQDQQDKHTAAAQAEQAKADAVTKYENDIRGVLQDLIDENGALRPETAGIVGMLDGRTPDVTESANKAVSKVERLVGLLDIGKLREMKAQSRTGASGFGALSEKELAVLESAASTLRNRRVSEATYAAELRRIRDTLGTPAAAAGASTLVNMVAPDGRRLQVPADKVTELKAHGAKVVQ